jgi:hypothetical protein
MRNSLDDQSTVLMSENGRIRRGIDFDKTTFSEGALRIAGSGPGSGITFDQGNSGEAFSDPINASLSIRVGAGGLKLRSPDGKRLICNITDNSIEICGGKTRFKSFGMLVRMFRMLFRLT